MALTNAEQREWAVLERWLRAPGDGGNAVPDPPRDGGRDGARDLEDLLDRIQAYGDARASLGYAVADGTWRRQDEDDADAILADLARALRHLIPTPCPPSTP